MGVPSPTAVAPSLPAAGARILEVSLMPLQGVKVQRAPNARRVLIWLRAPECTSRARRAGIYATRRAVGLGPCRTGMRAARPKRHAPGISFLMRTKIIWV